jgi:hypothetical protein
MAGDFQQKSKGRASRTFAGANHSCLTDRLTRGLTLLPDWNIIARTMAKSLRGRQS